MNRFLVIIGLSCIAAVVAADPIDGPTVLKRMLAAEGTVTFVAHQVTMLARGPSLTSEQIIYRDGFRGMRTEYISPPRIAGEVMIDNGTELIHYIPGRKVARLRPSRLFSLKHRTQEVLREFLRGTLEVELIGKDSIADRTALVLRVRPRGRQQGQARKIWVDSEKWVKLKTEDIAPDGTVLSTSYYTRIDFVNKIPPDKFRFEPPPGVRIERGLARMQVIPLEKVQRLVNFKVLQPKYLPKGFKHVGAAVIPFRRAKMVVLRYSDGVVSISLFQTPGQVLDRKFLERLHEGPMQAGKNAYSWRRGNLNLTLIGPIPPDEVRKIADSVR